MTITLLNIHALENTKFLLQRITYEELHKAILTNFLFLCHPRLLNRYKKQLVLANKMPYKKIELKLL